MARFVDSRASPESAGDEPEVIRQPPTLGVEQRLVGTVDALRDRDPKLIADGVSVGWQAACAAKAQTDSMSRASAQLVEIVAAQNYRLDRPWSLHRQHENPDVIELLYAD